jgi:pimeloyl-ACP methyl ester carboxylesterase
VTDREPQFLNVATGADGAPQRIAYIADPPATASGIGLFWLAGYKSDMASTKASALAAFAHAKGYGCTRFDYSGHGRSAGRFEDGTIGGWLRQAEAVFRRVAAERQGARQIIIGSSMGGWLALLLLRQLMREHPEEATSIMALVLIAPAWDMTEELMWKQFPQDARRQLMDTGVFLQPSEYAEPYAITRALIEEGRDHLLARAPFNPGRPIVILQGGRDDAVPPAHARELADFLAGGHARLLEVADGDHRLSRPEDLELLFSTVQDLAEGRPA